VEGKTILPSAAPHDLLGTIPLGAAKQVTR
jgi:hypothetical protein